MHATCRMHTAIAKVFHGKRPGACVDVKQAVVVRTDLGMGRGKIAAQAGHACVLGAEHIRKTHPEWFSQWFEAGQKKIVLKVPGIKELHEIKRHAVEIGLPCLEVADAGHTQVSPGTVTCVSVGPAPENLIDKITRDLKLL